MASVYSVVVLSLAVVVWVDFRTGAVLLAAGVLWAALLRWRLSDEAAGLLRVRRRRIDLTVLTLLGSAMLVLALVVPHH
jgi:predicted small integral membrane protein